MSDLSPDVCSSDMVRLPAHKFKSDHRLPIAVGKARAGRREGRVKFYAEQQGDDSKGEGAIPGPRRRGAARALGVEPVPEPLPPGRGARHALTGVMRLLALGAFSAHTDHRADR